ncbi:hypothetical protein AWJ20_856 [Sugiyamaella lignohabitans]|uniref:Uncharacterized protein n=1 Tax=Sugiyamaella lignohabitans TaxID=796027 RepID=A0A161HKZ6_9ASCO|nr:uncharacterized protein AWJ20_856 [Sugiyamaella lignohabitans]ANB12598.1 hypothetical protein AWJ20_856 [Sugiyamaella lignohabitans]
METQLGADTTEGTIRASLFSSAHDGQNQPNQQVPQRSMSVANESTDTKRQTDVEVSPSGSTDSVGSAGSSGSLNRASSVPFSRRNPTKISSPITTSSFFHNRDRPSPEISGGSQLSPPHRGHTKTPSTGGLSAMTDTTPNQVRLSLYSEVSGYSPVIEHATKVSLGQSSAHEEDGTNTGLTRQSTNDSDVSNLSTASEAPRKNSDEQIDKARESRHGLQSILSQMQEIRRSTSGGRVFPISTSSEPRPLTALLSDQSISFKENTNNDLQQSPIPSSIPDLRHRVPLRPNNGHGRSFSAATDSSSNYASSSYSSASQYPTLLSGAPKIGKSPMPVTSSTFDSASNRWDGYNVPAPTYSSSDGVESLLASLEKFRPRLEELQSAKRSSMVARIPSSSTNASNDTHSSSSSGFSYTSTPVRYDAPSIIKDKSSSSYSWHKRPNKLTDEQLRDDDMMLGLSPPRPSHFFDDKRRNSQDSSNESFQTALSHNQDSDSVVDHIQKLQEQTPAITATSSSIHLHGASELSHSSSGNTVVPPGSRRQMEPSIAQPSLSSFDSNTSPLRVNIHSRENTATLKNAASLPLLVPVEESEPIRRSIRASMMSYPRSGSDHSHDETRQSPIENVNMHMTTAAVDTTYPELNVSKREHRHKSRDKGKEKARDKDREGSSKDKTNRLSKSLGEQEHKSRHSRTSGNSRKREHHRNASAGVATTTTGEDLFSNRSTGLSSTSRVPRKAVFSQPNIQRLLQLADDAFDLDQIDLPPDERHLLEKFIDALSKLSVEINLDDGKRVEGKRRLHNALRAIEGWI